MAINLPSPPEQSVALLQSSLQRLPAAFGPGRRGSDAPGDAASASAIAYPHQVYSIGLQELIAENGLALAKLVSWRYILTQGGMPVASAEVNYHEQKGHSFSHLNQGPFTAATVTAIQDAQSQPQFAQNAYELRILRIPALYVTALWLKGASGAPDFYIPIAPANPAVTPGRAYSNGEFQEALRGPAQNALAKDTSPRG